jgi:glycosyltransferase involved in cell wall biosynthesis
MKRVVVFIPAWNEAEAIGELLHRVGLVQMQGVQFQSVVIDDGSTDQTAEIAQRNGAHVVTHGHNRGLGAAVRTGLQTAYELGADCAVMIDADLEYPPEAIPQLIAPILRSEQDYMLASRFRGKMRGMLLHRFCGNLFFTLVQMLIVRRWISDGQTGMRGFSRWAMSNSRIIHDYNYAQVLTIHLCRRGCRMGEIGIDYQVRTTGQSFIRFIPYVTNVFKGIWRELRTPVDVDGIQDHAFNEKRATHPTQVEFGKHR